MSEIIGPNRKSKIENAASIYYSLRTIHENLGVRNTPTETDVARRAFQELKIAEANMLQAKHIMDELLKPVSPSPTSSDA